MTLRSLVVHKTRELVAFGPTGESLGVRLDPLTQEDYEAIKASLRSWRDVLLCKTLRGTGLRIGELLPLSPQRLGRDGPEASFLYVTRNKTRRAPVWDKVFIPEVLAAELRSYIEGQHITLAQRIWPFSDRQARNIFAEAGRRALGHPVNPRDFRKLYVKWMVEQGLPVEAVAKMVGHRDPRTTLQYYYDLTTTQRKTIALRMPV